MQVIKVKPSGYCKGVLRAIKMVNNTIEKYPDQKIYILGMLVHNKYIVEAFNLANVITLNDPDLTKEQQLESIEEGVVIFTAHGISPQLKQRAYDKGLIVVDATCTDVEKNTKLCRDAINKGYQIIYIGKKNHPESEAVEAISPKIHLVTNAREIEELNLEGKLLVTNQTTMSILDIACLIEKIKQKYPDAEVAEEICNATRSRQTALTNLEGVDLLVVVGDPNSNNTTQLAAIGAKGVKQVLKVENARQLADFDFTGIEKVAVTAGASTPSYLTNQLIGYLETGESRYLEIDYQKILD